jgi:Sec-independent protein translocase protein TatA
MLIKHSFYLIFILVFASFDLLPAQKSISDSVRYFKKGMDKDSVIEYIHEEAVSQVAL